MKGKRMFLVTQYFWPENFIINDLVQQWVKDGLQVEVLAQWPSYPEGKVYDGYQNDSYKQERWGGVIIHRFKVIEGYKTSIVKKIFNYVYFVRKGRKIIDKIGFDFDHILVHQPGPLTMALPALYMKEKAKIPLSLWTFDIWPDAVYMYGFPKIWPITFFLNKIIKRVYRNSDNILVSSKMFSETIRSYVPDKPIYYIPNWLTLVEQKEAALKLNPRVVNFTFTGNVSVAQNLRNVILGFEKASISNAVLNIVGDGSNIVALQTLVKERRIANVAFHGRHPFNEMNDVMAQSDVLVLSLVSKAGVEKTEPYKLQSYLQSGKPIFGVIEGSGKSIIEGENIGFCSHPNDIDAIAHGFRFFINLPESLKEEFSNNARRLREERFNREKIIQNMNRIINL